LAEKTMVPVSKSISSYKNNHGMWQIVFCKDSSFAVLVNTSFRKAISNPTGINTYNRIQIAMQYRP